MTEPRRQTGFLSSLGSLIVFQVRLACDALRDLVMSPLSIAAFLLDVVIRPEPANSFHRKLMLFGRRTDRWINLFQEFDRDTNNPQPAPQETVSRKVEAEPPEAGTGGM